MSIAKRVTDGTGAGAYCTSYRNPHDGAKYVGPEIQAESRAAAEELARRLSYSGQPLVVEGLLAEEFPASLAGVDREAIKSEIGREVDAVIAAERTRAESIRLCLAAASPWPDGSSVTESDDPASRLAWKAFVASGPHSEIPRSWTWRRAAKLLEGGWTP